MHENKVIAAILQSRHAWQQVEEWIEEDDYTAYGWVILKGAQEYYKRDGDAQAVDREILLARIGRSLPNAKALDSFREILDKLPTNIGSRNVASELLAHKREVAEERLQSLLATRSGASTRDKLDALNNYNTLLEATDLESSRGITPYGVTLKELFTERLADKNKIKIHPPELNARLEGGALPGHCIVIFGRVEMGKSLFALNISAGITSQGKTVLWIENEDPLADTQRRFTQRVTRRPRKWIQDHPQEAEERFKSRGGENFILTQDPESIKDIQAAIGQFDPEVVVLNQMRNLAQGEDVTNNLDQIAHTLRRTGKTRDKLMILVTAAREGDVDRDGMIKPKPILEIGDCYGSRTGIPAVADVFIGVGGSDHLKQQCMMCISISKNKLVDGNTTSDGRYPKHGHFYVKVDPETGYIWSEERT